MLLRLIEALAWALRLVTRSGVRGGGPARERKGKAVREPDADRGRGSIESSDLYYEPGVLL